MDEAVIVGIGRTAPSRASGRSTVAMAAEAARRALSDAGLTTGDVDGVVSFAAGDSATSLQAAHAIGADELSWCLDLWGGGNYAATVVVAAAAAIATGQCTTAVVYRSLNGRSGSRFGTYAGRVEVGGEMQFGAPHGYILPPQWLAMWARRHQHVYGSTCEDLGQIAITQRAHAVPNPQAIAREPLTMDDYLAARWVNEPLRVPDCAYEVDGAAALVLTTSSRARDLPHVPIRILASAESHGSGGSFDQWPDETTMYSASVAPRLWSRAGIGPTDIDVACMYDCFTYTVLATVEDYGFCDKGAGGDFFAEGRATYGGDVVVNPHGGLLSEGYLHGLNHHVEAVLQLRGDGDARQVAGAELALVTAGAGPYGGAVVYGADR
jgi:acetyl-CoA acetyltransferase